jgi:glycosyltransferase involved in cell wall biosynthesis
MKKNNLTEQGPLISVIMAAKDASNFIDEAIRSIIHQRYTNWELIIVDDGSTDTTRSIADNWAQKDRRVNVLVHEKSTGQALARNDAVAKSHGTYLAILDADDVALPQRLEKQVAFLEANPDIALVGSQVEIMDVHGKTIMIKRKPTDHRAIHFSLLLQNQFTHSSIALRKDAFDTVGGYDNDFLYAEDYHLYTKLADISGMATIDEVLTRYRMQDKSTTRVSSSQKIQLEHYIQALSLHIGKYLPSNTDDAFLVFNFVNTRLSIPSMIQALFFIRRMARAYKEKMNLQPNEQRKIDIILKNTIKTCSINKMKKLFL